MKTVILAAGFGSRLWPLSTSETPKQFQPLIHGISLLRYTYEQLFSATPNDELYVLALEGMESLIYAELPNIATERIILVPERRNTLPHTLWALTDVTAGRAEPILFTSVDLFTHDPNAFTRSLKHSLERYDPIRSPLTLLCTDYTAYNSNDGYCIVNEEGIVTFLEKPSREVLDNFRKNNKVYRFPAMYITSIKGFLEVLEDCKERWAAGARRLLLSDSISRKQLFLDLPFLDINKAVFQKSHKMTVEKIDYSFIDVGRFEEVYELGSKDAYGNVILGNVIMGTRCRNSLLINETPKPLVVMSVNDSVVVQTDAGSLVAPFQEVSKIGGIYKSQIYKE